MKANEWDGMEVGGYSQVGGGRGGGKRAKLAFSCLCGVIARKTKRRRASAQHPTNTPDNGIIMEIELDGRGGEEVRGERERGGG